jgi:uncharacterized protein (DUF924 family)
MSRVETILRFWFGSPDLQHVPSPDLQELWFGKAEATDRTIRERFGPDLERAAAGQLAHWRAEPASMLALILVLDQFPRNMHRDTPGMFAYDALALAACQQALARGVERHVGQAQRTFLYLPLMHSEELAIQDRSIRCYERLVAEALPEQLEAARGALRFAQLHRGIIVRFGRYPHRNAILGRETTPEEAAFLTEPNSSF